MQRACSVRDRDPTGGHQGRGHGRGVRPDRGARDARRTRPSSRSRSRRGRVPSTSRQPARSRSYHRAMPMWRCPHCGTPQAETARCWVCRRSSTACGTCRNFRRSVAARLGYCGLDRSRQPLAGDEIRSCWEAWPGGAEATPIVPLDDPAGRAAWPTACAGASSSRSTGRAGPGGRRRARRARWRPAAHDSGPPPPASREPGWTSGPSSRQGATGPTRVSAWASVSGWGSGSASASGSASVSGSASGSGVGRGRRARRRFRSHRDHVVDGRALGHRPRPGPGLWSRSGPRHDRVERLRLDPRGQARGDDLLDRLGHGLVAQVRHRHLSRCPGPP